MSTIRNKNVKNKINNKRIYNEKKLSTLTLYWCVAISSVVKGNFFYVEFFDRILRQLKLIELEGLYTYTIHESIKSLFYGVFFG